ncbi:glycoside hydrolase family 18 protein [Silvanigrella aquatica]|uniref:chitinase n=1 Tax=Silvanigrella aquatica TaxID=1915309 RepID=A0A1L4CZS5_9BACT|nr:glycosyl hydrolase family 18 protein [Silvanigrella aquatica]APJ03450.1 hypothetical protein AXG55_05840 [Silvanigrella aquatica]
MFKKTSLNSIALISLLNPFSLAYAIQVTQNQSGQLPIDYNTNPNEPQKPSKYLGNRPAASLQWNYKGPWWPESVIPPPLSPRNYGVILKDKKEPLNFNGYNANLEKNIPFSHKSNKIIGLYLTEWAYWERAFPAEFTPAKNVTHVFYSFLALCDYERKNATENNGLIANENKYGAAILKAMCGQGMFPGKTGTNYDQNVFDKYNWEDQDVGANENNKNQPKKDFEITKYDPQASYFMLKAMEKMKTVNPNLKAMVSIGGWTLSSPFHKMVASPEGRTAFINSVIQFLQDNPFVDGIDIDWEFPGGGGAVTKLANEGYLVEKSRYTSLIKELRIALDNKFTGIFKKQLSAAVSASPSKLASIDFNNLKDDFDFINIMSYDLYGAFSRYPNHQAALHAKPIASVYGTSESENQIKDEAGNPITVSSQIQTNKQNFKSYSAEGAIKTILENNPEFPSQKLVLGAAAYSRGWHTIQVKAEHDKLFWHGVAAGKDGSLGVSGTFENGVSDFREIFDKHMTEGNTQNLYYDKQAEAAYIWKPKNTNENIISASVESFDSPQSVIAKAKFVKDYNLGELFAWDASTDNGLILNAMNAGLCNKKADGTYYSFEQKYAGIIHTNINEDKSITETISTSPKDTIYKFDGSEFCSVNESYKVTTPKQNQSKITNPIVEPQPEVITNPIVEPQPVVVTIPIVEPQPVVVTNVESNEKTSVTFINKSHVYILPYTQQGVWGTLIAGNQSETYAHDDTRLFNKAGNWGYKEGFEVPLNIFVNNTEFKECGVVKLKGTIKVVYENSICTIQ